MEDFEKRITIACTYCICAHPSVETFSMSIYFCVLKFSLLRMRASDVSKFP